MKTLEERLTAWLARDLSAPVPKPEPIAPKRTSPRSGPVVRIRPRGPLPDLSDIRVGS